MRRKKVYLVGASVTAEDCLPKPILPLHCHHSSDSRSIASCRPPPPRASSSHYYPPPPPLHHLSRALGPHLPRSQLHNSTFLAALCGSPTQTILRRAAAPPAAADARILCEQRPAPSVERALGRGCAAIPPLRAPSSKAHRRQLASVQSTPRTRAPTPLCRRVIQ